MGLSPSEMQEAIIKNLPQKTGKSLEDWLVVVSKIKVNTSKELLERLKSEFNLGHFQAQIIIKHFENKA